MASTPNTSWQAEGEKVEAVTDFIFVGSKVSAVTAAVKLKASCSLEESYGQPSRVLKSRDITLPAKVHIVKAMVFP